MEAVNAFSRLNCNPFTATDDAIDEAFDRTPQGPDDISARRNAAKMLARPVGMDKLRLRVLQGTLRDGGVVKATQDRRVFCQHCFPPADTPRRLPGCPCGGDLVPVLLHMDVDVPAGSSVYGNLTPPTHATGTPSLFPDELWEFALGRGVMWSPDVVVVGADSSLPGNVLAMVVVQQPAPLPKADAKAAKAESASSSSSERARLVAGDTAGGDSSGLTSCLECFPCRCFAAMWGCALAMVWFICCWTVVPVVNCVLLACRRVAPASPARRFSPRIGSNV